MALQREYLSRNHSKFLLQYLNAVLQLVRRLKQESSHRIWKQHADTLRHIYWSGHEIF